MTDLIGRQPWRSAISGIAGAFLLALMLPSGAHAAVQKPWLENIMCWFQPPEGRQADCARMMVAQNRADAGSRMVSFPVVIYRSGNRDGMREPLIVLGGGGPGNGVGIDAHLANDWWGFLDLLALAHGRDVVLIDQRGAGLSSPPLICSWGETEVAEELASTRPLAQHLRAVDRAMRRCALELEADGVDLGTYDAATVADDVEDLRRALGVRQWNLYGTSYAARIALSVMRRQPHSVRSAILDSPVTPEANFYEEAGATVERAFEAVFTACRNDSACRQAFPELDLVFANVVTRLQRQPVSLTVAWPQTLVPFTMQVDGERLLELLWQSLYDADALGRLPLVLHALERGSVDMLAPLARDLIKQYLSGGWSDGLYYAVMCKEEFPFNDFERALQESAKRPIFHPFNSRWLQSERTACEAWRLPPSPTVDNSPVRSPVPVLLLSGELDPVTPPEWARNALAHLPNAWFRVFPNVSHDVLGSDDCALQIAARFLQRPTRSPFEGGCFNTTPPIRFDLDY